MGKIIQVIASLHPLMRDSDQRIPVKAKIGRIAVSHRNKYCYYRIPKCANSTISRTLVSHEVGSLYDVSSDLSGAVAKSKFDSIISYKTWSSDLIGCGYFVFSFVRNPYARVLSAYLDKWSESKRVIYQEGIRSRTGLVVNTFADFVGYLESGGLYDNVHWCPQVCLLPKDLSVLSFVGHVETIGVDLPKVVSSIFGVGFSHVATREEGRTSAATRLDDYYSDALRHRIFELYKDDFTALGYINSY